MSGVTTLCPGDPQPLSGAPECFVFGGAQQFVIPPAPEPGPGDPNEEWVAPTTFVYGRRHQLLLCKPITHQVLVEVRSFRLAGEWGDKHGAPTEASGTVSAWDPAWELAGATRTTMYGQTVTKVDLKGLEWALLENGYTICSGVFQAPQTFDGDRFTLKLVGGEAVFDERTLGETEQRDFLEGRGSFPDPTTAGWSFDSGVEWRWNTTTPWEGARSLQVRALSGSTGMVYSPWVQMTGAEGFVRHPVGSAILRCTAGYSAAVRTEVQLSGGTVVRADFSTDEMGESSESDTGYQGPITSRGWLTPEVIPHQVRVGIRCPKLEAWLDIDYVRLQWPTLTGFPSERDLSLYPERIMSHAQYREGGSPWGISTQVRSYSGTTARISWAHQDDHPVGECLRTISEQTGGPDVWLSSDWKLIVEARRGSDRRDLVLNDTTMRSCKMTFDPGNEKDELRALTDLGRGPSRVLHGFDTARRADRRRIRTLIQSPHGLGYDVNRAWAQGQHEFASRLPVSAECVVSYDEGLRYRVGDGVAFAHAEGGVAWWGAMRVAARKFSRSSDTCTLTVGTDPEVML